MLNLRKPEVRKYLYGIGAALLPLLTAYGVVNAQDGGLWLAVLGAVLGTSGMVMATYNTNK